MRRGGNRGMRRWAVDLGLRKAVEGTEIGV
jgi:hypothetical protein